MLVRINYNKCSIGVNFLGGYNNFGKGALLKKKMVLQPHFKLVIKFILLKMDIWEDEEAFLKINGETRWSKTLNKSYGYITPLCGGTK